jgi:hypothetical protein
MFNKQYDPNTIPTEFRSSGGNIFESFTSENEQMMIDIKSMHITTTDMRSLYQAIERVFECSKTNETIKRSICFATTGFASFMVILQRERERDGKQQLIEHLDIVNIKTDDLLPLSDWCHYKAYSDPCFVLFEDWYVVRDLLASVEIDPSLCRIHDSLGKSHTVSSSSRFYRIFLPRNHSSRDYATTTTVLDLSDEEDAFFELVVKINGNRDRARQEIQIINKIQNKWDEMHPHDKILKSSNDNEEIYVLATMSSHINHGEVTRFYDQNDMIAFFDHHIYHDVNNPQTVSSATGSREKIKNLVNFSDSHRHTVGPAKLENNIDNLSKFLTPSAKSLVKDMKCAWWQRSGKSMIQKGKELNGMLMLKGYPRVQVDPQQLINHLNWIHQNPRILHCDLRPQNVIAFPAIPNIIPDNQYSFIIDFDLANELPAGTDSMKIELHHGARKELLRKFSLLIDDRFCVFNQKVDERCLDYSFIRHNDDITKNTRINLLDAQSETVSQSLRPSSSAAMSEGSGIGDSWSRDSPTMGQFVTRKVVSFQNVEIIPPPRPSSWSEHKHSIPSSSSVEPARKKGPNHNNTSRN